MDAETETDLKAQVPRDDDDVTNEQEADNFLMADQSESDESDCDIDYADNEEEDEHDQEKTQSNVDGSEAGTSRKTKSKKRKRPSNKRRNIRKVFRSDQLDSKTIDAQQLEQERLKRLELQRSLLEHAPSTVTASKTIGEDDSKISDNSIIDDSVIILDDDNDSDPPQVAVPQQQNIIMISSSESEEETEIQQDEQPDSPDEAADLIAKDYRADNGRVLVNVNHPVEEPDIFLPPHISSVVKPHQVSGIRFLYENLIESLTHFKVAEGFGCVLAHSMGLGKTIQTISLIHVFLKYTIAKKVLIIVPINTLQNWLCEFNMWIPQSVKKTDKNEEKKQRRASQEKVVENSENSKSSDEGIANKEVLCVGEEDKVIESIPQVPTSSQNNLDDKTIDASETEADISEVPQVPVQGKSDAKDFSAEESVVDKDLRDYKVFLIGDGQKTTVSRAKVIGEWHQDGGVLLMGYEMYRIISMYTPSMCNSVTNAKGKRKKQKAKKSNAVIDIEEEEKEMQLFVAMQKALCRPGPDLVVCDEGHRIKNSQSNIHQALHRIRTRKRLVLTGYPLQNNLTEYWCMVDFVRPSYLGTKQEFQNMFERPIINGQCVDSTAGDKKLMKYRAHVLSSLLKGFIQRRGYTALKHALPPKQEHVLMVRLSRVQEAVYRRFIELMQDGDQLNPIKMFAVCSKIWNHPDILYKAMKADESKRVDLFDTDEDIALEDGTKPKQTKSSLKKAQNGPNFASDEGFNPFGGDSKALLVKITDWAKEVFESHNFKEGMIETSGKIFLLLEIIKESLARGDRLLVFSQSLLTLDLLEEILGRTPVFQYQPNCESPQTDGRTWRKNLDYFRLDGSTPAVERERLIDSFNSENNTNAKLFMLSTRAGCLGINLIGANRVVVFDVSWNPCYDAQAVCRIYRYGQTKPCYIYRLVASNTMEKRMYYRQISKQGVSDRVVDELNPVENFTKDEVSKLLTTTWDNEPERDYTAESEEFDDPVLKKICQTCGNWIVTVPFKHESLLEDQHSSKLSREEKREAKLSYEEEKRRALFTTSVPYTARGPQFPSRPSFPVMQQPMNQPPHFPAPSAANAALYGQYAMFGNLMAGPDSHLDMQGLHDMNRLRTLFAQYSAMAGDRDNMLNTMTPQIAQFPYQGNTSNSSPAMAIRQNGTRTPDSVSSAQLPALAPIPGLQASLPGQASSSMPQWKDRGHASNRPVFMLGEDQSQSQSQFSNSLENDGNEGCAVTVGNHSAPKAKQSAEVICLDTDEDGDEEIHD